MADETKEQKIDAIAGEVATVAGAAGLIPSPASPALILFSQIEPIVGPLAVEAFGRLFHKIKHSKKPKEAADVALVAAHDAVQPYIEPDDTTSQYAG